MYRAKISPNLKKIFEKGERGEVLTLLLADGRRVKCRFEMLTYANKSDTDDTDVMVGPNKIWRWHWGITGRRRYKRSFFSFTLMSQQKELYYVILLWLHHKP